VVEAVALGVQVPQVSGQHVGVLLGVPGDDAAADDQLGNLDALLAEDFVEQLRVGGLPGERDGGAGDVAAGLDRGPTVTNRMVPRFSPRKRMPGTTWCTAATGP